jgi:hypothetical protein
VNGWRKLPHIDLEVQRLYEYPQKFAEEIYERIEGDLRQRDSDAAAGNVSSTGRLYIVSANDPENISAAPAIPELPAKYAGSSDKKIVSAHKAELYDQAQLLRGRQEGHFLVSYETAGGWTALKKELLTDLLGTGCDARIVGLPLDAVQVLRLMCIDLAIADNSGDQATVPPSMKKA